MISKDGFILWARSSQRALKSGLYYKTRNRPPVEIPPASLAAQCSPVEGLAGEAEHNCDVWLKEPCKEHVLFSQKYDFTMSLLHFNDAPERVQLEEEVEEDTYERMMRRNPGQSWLG